MTITRGGRSKYPTAPGSVRWARAEVGNPWRKPPLAPAMVDSMTAGGNLITSREAAPLLGVSERYVRLLAARGHLAAAIETPWGRLFERTEVERLAAERSRRRAVAE